MPPPQPVPARRGKARARARATATAGERWDRGRRSRRSAANHPPSLVAQNASLSNGGSTSRMHGGVESRSLGCAAGCLSVVALLAFTEAALGLACSSRCSAVRCLSHASLVIRRIGSRRKRRGGAGAVGLEVVGATGRIARAQVWEQGWWW